MSLYNYLLLVFTSTIQSYSTSASTNHTIDCDESISGIVGGPPDSAIIQFTNLRIQDVTFSNCDSAFDSQLYLLNSNGNKIQNQSDNNCDGNDCYHAGYCNTPYRETFTMIQLSAGTYSIIITPDPYNSGGSWTLSVDCSNGIPTSNPTSEPSQPTFNPTSTPTAIPTISNISDSLCCDCLTVSTFDQPGCGASTSCEQAVCEQDAFCCVYYWDSMCVDTADSFCPYNRTDEPTTDPSSSPSAEPTIFRNDSFPTSAPTTSPIIEELLEEHLVLYSHGNFSEMKEYAQSHSISMEHLAVNIIGIAIQLDQFSSLKGITIEVTRVREGSIVIEYTLKSPYLEVLELATRNIQVLLGLDLLIGGSFTLQILSNNIATDMPTFWPSYFPTLEPTEMMITDIDELDSGAMTESGIDKLLNDLNISWMMLVILAFCMLFGCSLMAMYCWLRHQKRTEFELNRNYMEDAVSAVRDSQLSQNDKANDLKPMSTLGSRHNAEPSEISDIPGPDEQPYLMIIEVLQSVVDTEWRSCLETFKRERMTDDALRLIPCDTAKDEEAMWKVLIPAMGIRVRFKEIWSAKVHLQQMVKGDEGGNELELAEIKKPAVTVGGPDPGRALPEMAMEGNETINSEASSGGSPARPETDRGFAVVYSE